MTLPGRREVWNVCAGRGSSIPEENPDPGKGNEGCGAENAETPLSESDNKSARALYLSLLTGIGVGSADIDVEDGPRLTAGIEKVARSDKGASEASRAFGIVVGIAVGSAASKTGKAEATGKLVGKGKGSGFEAENVSSSAPPKKASNLDGESDTLRVGGSYFEAPTRKLWTGLSSWKEASLRPTPWLELMAMVLLAGPPNG